MKPTSVGGRKTGNGTRVLFPAHGSRGQRAAIKSQVLQATLRKEEEILLMIYILHDLKYRNPTKSGRIARMRSCRISIINSNKVASLQTLRSLSRVLGCIPSGGALGLGILGPWVWEFLGGEIFSQNGPAVASLLWTFRRPRSEAASITGYFGRFHPLASGFVACATAHRLTYVCM